MHSSYRSLTHTNMYGLTIEIYYSPLSRQIPWVTNYLSLARGGPCHAAFKPRILKYAIAILHAASGGLISNFGGVPVP